MGGEYGNTIYNIAISHIIFFNITHDHPGTHPFERKPNKLQIRGPHIPQDRQNIQNFAGVGLLGCLLFS